MDKNYTEEPQCPEQAASAFQETWTPNHILFYGPENRALALFDSISKESSLALISQLLELDTHPYESITLHLNTDGGLLADGFAIYDCIKGLTSPVRVLCAGVCASAGLLILAAGSLRYATDNCLFFYHQTIIPPEAVSSLEQISSCHQAYAAYQSRYDNILRANSFLSEKEYSEQFLGKTSKYFFAKEALECGIIDTIVNFNLTETTPQGTEQNGQ